MCRPLAVLGPLAHSGDRIVETGPGAGASAARSSIISIPPLMRSSVAALRSGLSLVVHSPLSALWLLVGVVGVVRGVRYPSGLPGALAAIGALAGARRLVARVRGVAPWPPSPRALVPDRPRDALPPAT